MTEQTTIPAVGSRVEFLEDTPQHAANKGIVYVVEAAPNGDAYSIDRTRKADGTNAYPNWSDAVDRPYVWLVHEADADKAPSRRRRRTGLASALRTL